MALYSSAIGVSSAITTIEEEKEKTAHVRGSTCGFVYISLSNINVRLLLVCQKYLPYINLG